MIPKQTMSALVNQQCRLYQASEQPLSEDQLSEYSGHVTEWKIIDGWLCRKFKFKNYYQTIAFVNAVAFVVHLQDHHPDIELGYNRCLVKFHTHSVDGLTLNDYICAARIDALDA